MPEEVLATPLDLQVSSVAWMLNEVLEFGKHRKGTDGHFCPFGQRFDPISAQIAKETGSIR